jgi:hypothetical protein
MRFRRSFSVLSMGYFRRSGEAGGSLRYPTYMQPMGAGTSLNFATDSREFTLDGVAVEITAQSFGPIGPTFRRARGRIQMVSGGALKGVYRRWDRRFCVGIKHLPR